MSDSSCLIFAHRGASAYLPDNTLAAFELAIRQGAQALEMDVRMTKDQTLVVCHGKKVKTGNRKKKISQLTIRELEQLDGIEACSLEKIVKRFKSRAIFDFDIKEKGLEEKFVQLFKKTDLDKDQVFFNSNKIEVLKTLKKVMPQARLVLSYTFFDGLDIGKRRILLSLAAALSRGMNRVMPTRFKRRAVESKVFAVSLPYSLVYQGLVDYFHQHGIKVFAWPPESERVMRNLITMGVDGIKTGKPDLLVRVLKESSC